MATVYPQSIDDTITLPIVFDSITNINAEIINRLRDAIVAIEGELGVKPSGLYTTVRHRLDAMELLIASISGGGGGGGGSNITFAGDLTGIDTFQSVIGLRGKLISPTTPTNGQVLQYNGSQWVPTTLSTTPSGSAGGDLGGTYPNPSVVKLQGVAVSSTSPTLNQILKYDGYQWAPATTASIYPLQLPGDTVVYDGTTPAIQSPRNDNIFSRQVMWGGVNAFGNANIISQDDVGGLYIGDDNLSTGWATCIIGYEVFLSAPNDGYIQTRTVNFADTNNSLKTLKIDNTNQYIGAYKAILLDFNGNPSSYPTDGYIKTKYYGSAKSLWKGFSTASLASEVNIISQSSRSLLFGDYNPSYGWATQVDGYNISLNSYQGASIYTSAYLNFLNWSAQEVLRFWPLTSGSTPQIEIHDAVTTPSIGQKVHSSSSGTNFSIFAQSAGGSNNNGGSLNLKSGAKTGSGADGYVSLFNASVEGARLQDGYLNAVYFGVGGLANPQPTISSGTGVPFGTPQQGSIYLRKDGYAASGLYIYQDGYWSPLTGVVNIVSTTSNYNISNTEYLISVGTLGAPITIYLPSSPQTGRVIYVKDTAGGSQTNNITVDGNGKNIDGSATFIINVNYASVSLVYTGSQWSVV